MPLSGKSTVFNALTGGTARTGVFSGARNEVHVCVVEVPDERVSVLSEILKPEKTNKAKIEYVDVVGIEKGSARKGSSSVEFLSPVRQADALLHVARAFLEESVPHPLGEVDAARDVDALEEEFIIADLLAVEKRLEKIGKLGSVGKKPEEKGEAEMLEKCRKHLLEETPLREIEFSTEEERILRCFQFLSVKPLLVAINAGEDAAVPDMEAQAKTWTGKRRGAVSLCGKLEMEIAGASPEDAAELMELAELSEPASLRMIKASYELLGLLTFFTAVRSELTAWPIQSGTTAVGAAGEIHTDMEKGFIRAEVVGFDDLVACGSVAGAREKGLLRIEGKGYEVRDGDLLNIRFSA